MKVFISYSQEDKDIASLIAEELRTAGHELWDDPWSLRPGDNIIEKVNVGLKEADALIILVSNNALRSKWVMHEFSAIALSDLSNNKRRIIPVIVDNCSLPQYLAQYSAVDLNVGVEFGVQQILLMLTEPAPPALKPDLKRTYDSAIATLSKALHAGRLTLVCGAGTVVDAGIPTWHQLLVRLLESMMCRITQDRAIPLCNVTPEEFQRRYGPSALMVGKYLKSNLGEDFLSELRDALYANEPKSCAIVDAIVELSRPQRDGKPLESIITFNFDSIVEEQMTANNIPHKTIFSEGTRNHPNELPIYHVHGFLPRVGVIEDESEIVFSEEAYHSQFIDPFSWSNLIQLNKLSQNTCLFIGVSLTDPNLRRLLDVSNRKNPSRHLNHYIIKKIPLTTDGAIDQLSFLLEEQDANELGLNLLWVSDFPEIAPMLRRISSNSILS